MLKPGFTLDPETAESIPRIARTVAGIPLAIELAASRLRMLSPAEIDRRLEQSFRLLRRKDRDTNPHHQTLDQAIDWSYKMLSNEQQLLFRRLSVFRGSFTMEATAALHETEDDLELLETLGELLNKSMVQRSTAGTPEISRYVVLEPLRQFAEARTDAAELRQARDDHAEYFAGYAENVAQLLRGPNQINWLKDVRADDANLVAAITHAVDAGRPDPTRRISAALLRFWLAERQLVEINGHLAAALAMEGGAPVPRAYALISHAFAVCTLEPNRSEETLALVREGNKMFCECGMGVGVGQARIHEGIVLWNHRELDAAASSPSQRWLRPVRPGAPGAPLRRGCAG